MDIKLYQHLPVEIVNHILSYDGKIKYRNGEYINQIEKTDKRFLIIKKIYKPKILYESYEYENRIHIRIRFPFVNSKNMQIQLSKTLRKLPDNLTDEIVYYLFIYRGLSCITRTITHK